MKPMTALLDWLFLSQAKPPKQQKRAAIGRERQRNRLANEIVEIERLKRDPAHASDEGLKERRYRLALEAKQAIEEGISRHGVASLGLTLDDLLAAEDEFKAAGLEDWRLKVTL